MLTFNFMILSLHHYVPMSISILISWRLELCDICTSKARFSNHYWVISKKQFGTSRDQLATCNKYVSLKKKSIWKAFCTFHQTLTFHILSCVTTLLWMCLCVSHLVTSECAYQLQTDLTGKRIVGKVGLISKI